MIEDLYGGTPTPIEHNKIIQSGDVKNDIIFELLECVKELKDNNQRTSALLEKVLKLVIANESRIHERFEKEKQDHTLSMPLSSFLLSIFPF